MDIFESVFMNAAFGAGASTSIFALLLGSFLVHRLTLAREAEARLNAAREKRREESRAVAEILSEWVRSNYTGRFDNEDRWRLQTTYWKNIIGLDPALVALLLPCLAHAPDAAGTNEIVVEARRILLGLDKADIPGTALNSWRADLSPSTSGVAEGAR